MENDMINPLLKEGGREGGGGARKIVTSEQNRMGEWQCGSATWRHGFQGNQLDCAEGAANGS